MEQVAEDKRGWRAMELMRDDKQQQISNQTLMAVAKAGGDTFVKAKAAPVVNGAFCCCVDHGRRGGKVGAIGRVVVNNRQQWQWQSGNNQLKVTVVSSGIDSCGGSGKQRQSRAICSKTPMAKAIVIAPPTPLLLSLADGAGPAVAAATRE